MKPAPGISSQQGWISIMPLFVQAQYASRPRRWYRLPGVIQYGSTSSQVKKTGALTTWLAKYTEVWNV